MLPANSSAESSLMHAFRLKKHEASCAAERSTIVLLQRRDGLTYVFVGVALHAVPASAAATAHLVCATTVHGTCFHDLNDRRRGKSRRPTTNYFQPISSFCSVCYSLDARQQAPALMLAFTAACSASRKLHHTAAC
eukprot:365987-Chlamydomonas_euryale.AAC.27